MQFPTQLDSWNYEYELQEALNDIEEKENRGQLSEGARHSFMSNNSNNYVSPSIMKDPGKDQFGNLIKQRS